MDLRSLHLCRRAILIVSLATTAGLPVATAQPSVGLPSVPIPAFGGTVNQVRRDGNRLIVAGDFLGASPPVLVRGGLSIHHAVTADRVHDTTFIFGDVYATAPDGLGGYYIGGRLYGAQTSLRIGIAHLNPDGTLDERFSAAVTNAYGIGIVRAIELVGNVLYIGGEFDAVNGQVRVGLAALDATNGAPLPFNPLALRSSGAGTVRTLLTHQSVLYVGGAFEWIGGASRNSVAAFDIATGALLPWDPDVTGEVRDMLVFGQAVMLGGSFISVGGQPRENLAGVSLTSGAPTNFAPGVSGGLGAVNALASIGGMIVAGGSFTGVYTHPGLVNLPHLAAFDPLTSGVLLGWGQLPSEPVESLATRDGVLYVGGHFNLVGLGSGQEQRGGAVAYDWDNSRSLLPWNPRMNGSVFSLVADGARIVMGGTFTAPGATPRRSVAMVDLTTLQLSSWTAPTVAGAVDALGVAGNKVFIGGKSLDAVSGFGPTHRNLTVLDDTTGQELPWPQGPDGPVTTIETGLNRIYIAGTFTAAGGQPRQRLASYDPGGTLTSFVAHVTGAVQSLAVDGTRLYVGGALSAVNGVPRQGLAAVDAMTGAVHALNVPVVGPVRTLAVEADALYLGGEFSLAGGAVRRGLASINLLTNTLSAWNPNAAVLGGSTRVDTISVRGGRAFVGGPFGVIGGVPRRGFAMIEATGAVSGFDLYLHDEIWTSYVDDQLVILGGGVDLAAGFSVSNLAVFPAVVLPLPGPPVDLRVAVAGNNVAFSWSPPPVGAAFTGYVLEAGTAPGTTLVTLPLGPVTGFALPAPSGVFWVRLRAVGPSGSGPASNEVQVSVPSCSQPAVPSPLWGSVSGNLITLAWPAAVGTFTSYLLEAGTATGLSNLAVVPMSITALTVAVPPGTYYLRVRAATACAQSAPSNEVVLTVAGPSLPAAPGTPTATVTGNLVSLSWTPPPGGNVDSYILEAGTSAASPANLAVAQLGPATQFATPAPPGRYFIRVRARNAAGIGPPSGQVIVDVR